MVETAVATVGIRHLDAAVTILLMVFERSIDGEGWLAFAFEVIWKIGLGFVSGNVNAVSDENILVQAIACNRHQLLVVNPHLPRSQAPFRIYRECQVGY